MADWASDLMQSKGKTLPDLEDFSKLELEDFNEIFKRFAELSEAIDNLDLCLGFIKARTPRQKSVKLDSYLNYHISFYLQEIYILKERIKKYTIRIKRLRKKRGLPFDPAAYDAVTELVEHSLSTIVSARGSHVHDRPFVDDEMRMLGAYSFLAVHRQDEPNWLSYARLEYSVAKRTWTERLTNNKVDLNKLLDSVFAFLHMEVFDRGLVTAIGKP